MPNPLQLQFISKASTLGRVLLGIVILFSVFDSSSYAASTAPRVQQSDITYIGAFRMPTATYGGSSFNYGGRGLSYYKDTSSGKRTLFMQGHGYNPGYVAQIEIPSNFSTSSDWNSLPEAKVLQNFSDVTEGTISRVDPTNTSNATYVTGLLAYNKRLIVGATNTYSFSQSVSHGVSGLTLSTSGDWKGWYSFSASAPSRALGWMAPIPSEWQSAFGGPALTGQCCVSVISTTSQGPSVTVFNPDDVGQKSPIPGTTVLFYPTAHFLRDGSTQNDVYNLTTRVGGVFFPPGTRSVIFVGGHGTGPYCYGTAAECNNDTAMSDVKGPHAQPYRYQVWAYDANDLAAVKSGTKSNWEPQPYGVWELKGMHHSGNPNISGATYDPESGQLFITQDYGEQPMVEVYQITVTGATTTEVKPEAPTGLLVY